MRVPPGREIFSSGAAIGAQHPHAACLMPHAASIGRAIRPRQGALLISQSHARRDGWMLAQCNSQIENSQKKQFENFQFFENFLQLKFEFEFEFESSRVSPVWQSRAALFTVRRRQFALGQAKVATETPQRLSNICNSNNNNNNCAASRVYHSINRSIRFG